MSQSEFERQMAALKRRQELLRAHRNGLASVQAVKVRAFTVKEHKVRAHTRLYYRLES